MAGKNKTTTNVSQLIFRLLSIEYCNKCVTHQRCVPGSVEVRSLYVALLRAVSGSTPDYCVAHLGPSIRQTESSCLPPSDQKMRTTLVERY